MGGKLMIRASQNSEFVSMGQIKVAAKARWHIYSLFWSMKLIIIIHYIFTANDCSPGDVTNVFSQ